MTKERKKLSEQRADTWSFYNPIGDIQSDMESFWEFTRISPGIIFHKIVDKDYNYNKLLSLIEWLDQMEWVYSVTKTKQLIEVKFE